MATSLPVADTPTVIVAPPPTLGGRYRLEFRGGDAALAPSSTCGHQSPQALLWLIFLEADQEAGRELCAVICSGCDPARFSRAQAWAEALA